MIYTLSTDTYIQGLAPGTTTDLAGTPFISPFVDETRGGHITFQVVEHGGRNSLAVVSKGFTQDSPRLNHDAFNFQPRDRITITGRTGPGWLYGEGSEAWAAVMLNANVGDWNPIAQQDWWEPSAPSMPFTLGEVWLADAHMDNIEAGGGLSIIGFGNDLFRVDPATGEHYAEFGGQMTLIIDEITIYRPE